MIRTFGFAAALAAGVAGHPQFALAQTPVSNTAVPAEPAAQPTQPAPAPVVAGWQDGFFMQSADGAYRLAIGLVAQADGRYVDDDSAGAALDTFTIRKFRPMFVGRIARFFDFQVVPDFGNGTTVVQDAFLDARFSPGFRVRLGKSKTPVGYEILVSDPFLLFPERSLASQLVPNRDVGVQALGDFAGGRFAYGAGVYNGIPDGSSASADVDNNSSKDYAGRFVVQPFRTAGEPGALSGLGFALGGSIGEQSAALPSFRTSVGRRFFAYDAAAAASGERRRLQPAFFYYYKALGTFAEFTRSTQAVTRGATEVDVANRAWGITGSLVLTGETGADRGVRPRVNFDPTAGTWGALQLVARYSQLRVDDAAFESGVAAASNAREILQVTVGANWYPAAFIKYYVAFEHTTFDGASGEILPETSVILRAQVNF